MTDFLNRPLYEGATVIYTQLMPGTSIPELRLGLVQAVDSYGVTIQGLDTIARRLATNGVISTVALIGGKQ